MSCRVRSRRPSSSGATATLEADAHSAASIPKGQDRNQKAPRGSKGLGNDRTRGCGELHRLLPTRTTMPARKTAPGKE